VRAQTKCQRSRARAGRAPRRVIQACLAGLLLLLLAPLIAVIVAAIVIETGRPLFFLHTRIGQHGKSFSLVKFRKFRRDLGSRQLPLTMRHDPRPTRVGEFLERSKLDELPQLWNVLRGEMAIVGPRPESLEFRDCFENGFRAVLDHAPGIVGPSQALFRNEKLFYRPDRDPVVFYRTVLFPAKARIDLAYYPNRTLRSDLAWAFYCGLVVFGYSPRSRRLAAVVNETANFIRHCGEPVGSEINLPFIRSLRGPTSNLVRGNVLGRE
jgi:lipopolysaccharide/colanic/teichoic acid biosynthesis glycosyltransferase